MFGYTEYNNKYAFLPLLEISLYVDVKQMNQWKGGLSRLSYAVWKYGGEYSKNIQSGGGGVPPPLYFIKVRQLISRHGGVYEMIF